MFNVCLLGTGGTMPMPDRYLTSLLINFKGKKILVDCGEGTQVSMKMIGWGFKTIDVICLTHFHADHIAGLPGLLLTIGNSDRTEPLTIVGPKGLKNIIDAIRVLCPYLPYEINLIEVLDFDKPILSIEELDIFSVPVDHGIDCLAFSFHIKRNRKFDINKAKNNNVPMCVWKSLQNNEYITYNNIDYTPDMVLGENRDGLKISYSTDTRPSESLLEFVKDSNLLIAEGMYGEDTEIGKAIENKHMLFSEAAIMAKNSNCTELWLTHFSPSLSEPNLYLNNATNIFLNTIIGSDRLIKTLEFSKDNN